MEFEFDFCDECGYDVPTENLIDGICDLCYDEDFGEFDQIEKIPKHSHEDDYDE